MDGRGEGKKRLEGGHRRPPAVETKRELVHGDLEVVVAHAVVDAPELGLEVAKDPMDVRQEHTQEMGRGKPNKPVKLKRLTLDLPEDLHRAIKVSAAQEGVTMAEKLRALLLRHYALRLRSG